MTKGLFDTALMGGSAFAGKAWLFKDGEYIRVKLADMSVEQPRKPIIGNWGQNNTWPGTYANSIDAVLRGTGAFAGKCWFFRGDTYIRYDLASDKAEITPQPIVGNWAGANWPKTLVGGIDAVLDAPSGNTFILRGGMAVEYSLATDTIVDGPFWIEDRWPAIVDALYPSDVHWGVDSLNAANHRLGSQTLYEYVSSKCGMQPRFWGRYLGLLTPIEAAYLLDRGVAILPIFRNVTAAFVAGGRVNGQQAGQQAVDLATSVGVPPNTALFVDIEPDWHPSKAFLLGWWDKLEPSLFFDGIYCNPHRASGFGSVYPSAFDARPSEVPPMTAPTFLWSQFPQVPPNADFSGCPTGREARSREFKPIVVTRSDGTRVNETGLGLWQFKINCLPFPVQDIHGPVPVNAGNIDNNLAQTTALERMWR